MVDKTSLSIDVGDQRSNHGGGSHESCVTIRRQAGGLTVTIPRTVAAHVQALSARLDPDLAAEGFVALDLQPRPAAVPGDLEHVGDRVGIGLAGAQPSTGVGEGGVGRAVVSGEAFGP